MNASRITAASTIGRGCCQSRPERACQPRVSWEILVVKQRPCSFFFHIALLVFRVRKCSQAPFSFPQMMMLFTFVIRIAEHPARADKDFYQPGSVIRRRRTIYWRTADYVLSKIKLDYRRSSCSAQTEFILRIIF